MLLPPGKYNFQAVGPESPEHVSFCSEAGAAEVQPVPVRVSLDEGVHRHLQRVRRHTAVRRRERRGARAGVSAGGSGVDRHDCADGAAGGAGAAAGQAGRRAGAAALRRPRCWGKYKNGVGEFEELSSSSLSWLS